MPPAARPHRRRLPCPCSAASPPQRGCAPPGPIRRRVGPPGYSGGPLFFLRLRQLDLVTLDAEHFGHLAELAHPRVGPPALPQVDRGRRDAGGDRELELGHALLFP